MSRHKLPRLGLLTLALAVPALSPAQAIEPAGASIQRNYNIPAGPLEAALNRFGRDAGILLSFSTSLTAGLHSPGLQGKHDANTGLSLLLQGTGLVPVRQSNDTYTLRQAPAAAASGASTESILPVVKVLAQSEKDGTTEGTGSYTTRSSKSATGLSLSLRDTPQSVTVITHQRMEDQGMTAVQAALESVTGVSVQALDSGRNQVFARGFNIDNFQIDGMPVVSGNVGIETASTVIYDRVEVVRGATGLLNGVGEPSATVNLVRKRADSNTFAGSVKTEVGSWSHGAVTADLSTPLNTSATVRGRLVAHALSENSFRDREGKKTTVLYGVVEADLTPDTRLSVGGSQQVDKRDGMYWGGLTYWYADGTRTHWPRSTNNAARWNRWDTDERTAFARLEHTLANDWKLRADLGYYKKTEESKALYMSGLPDRATGLGYEPFVAHYDYGPNTQTQYSFSATGPFSLLGREHELTMGVIGSRSKFGLRAAYARDAAPIGNFNTWNGNYPEPAFDDLLLTSQSDTRRISTYAVSRLQLADSLKLILGAQVTQWKLNEGAGAWSSGPYTISKHVFTPYGGLVYDLTRNLSAYVSYTKIFKPQMLQDRNGRYLSPIDGRGMETGVKGEFLNGRLNASAAVFRIDQDNVAVSDVGYFVPGTTTTASRPARGAKSQGIELDVSGEIARRWHLGAGWTKYSSRDAQGEQVNAQNPRQHLKLFTKYEFDGELAGLALGGGVIWQDTPPFTQTNPVTGLSERVGQPAYALVDLMASYRMSRQTDVQLNIKNLLNKYYYFAPWDSPTFGASRNVNLQLKHTF